MKDTSITSFFYISTTIWGETRMFINESLNSMGFADKCFKRIFYQCEQLYWW